MKVIVRRLASIENFGKLHVISEGALLRGVTAIDIFAEVEPNQKESQSEEANRDTVN